MDKRLEDKIAKMAFGELSAAEAAEVKAHAETNVDAARALESYEGLRADLRRMKDVPPEQLSKERLQSAILAQGLNPKPVRSAFPWAWAGSLAVAGVLMGLVYLNRPSQIGETGYASNYNPQSQTDLTLNLDDQQLLKRTVDIQAPVPDVAPVVEKPATADPTPAVSSSEIVSYQTSGNRSSYRRHYYEPYRGATRPEIVSAPVVQGPPAPTPLAIHKSDKSLVLIQSEKDGNTGASNAVEVHQTQDVIVSS